MTGTAAADSYRTGHSDRAVLLAHGAGSGREAPVLQAVAAALGAAGIASLRFDYPYRQRGRRAPAPGPAPEELVLGGRSMGGRYCSLVAADADDPVPARGLLLLGYPLHPAGKPDQLRVEHFGRLRVPCLFVSGTRDALAGRDELARAARAIPGPVTFHWVEGADHAYRVRASGGRSVDDVDAEVAEVAASWVAGL